MNIILTIFGVRLLLGVGLAAFTVYTLISLWAARKWRHSRRLLLDSAWTPAVTILKPVRGVDAEAYENFASFCRLDYPTHRFQLIFGALDPDDPALALACRLQSEFPQCDITVMSGGPSARRGYNLKVCNLISMLPMAKHDLLVLCDSDMRVQPDYLRRLVAPFQQNEEDPQISPINADFIFQHQTPESPNHFEDTKHPVGLVTCPYRGFHPRSFAAVLEGLGIGADFIPSAFVGRALQGVSFAFGSTIALPRQVLAQIGGFEALLDELADDFRLGDGVRRAGYRVVLSDYVVDDVLGRERFGLMWARRLRWARTVRSCRPVGYAGAFITHGMPLALLFLLAMGGSAPGWLALVWVIALRYITALTIAITCTEDAAIRHWWPLLPLSDLFSFILYVGSYAGNQIIWRGDRFRLLPGGRMVLLQPDPIPQPEATSGT